MRCHGHMAHGTSQLHTSVRSLRFLHYLGPPALGSVNRVDTYTSVCNLYLRVKLHVCLSIILHTADRETDFPHTSSMAWQSSLR